MSNSKRSANKGNAPKPKAQGTPNTPKKTLFKSGVKLGFSCVSYTRDSDNLGVVDYHHDDNSQHFQVSLDLPGVSMADVQVALQAVVNDSRSSRGMDAKAYQTLQALANAWLTQIAFDTSLMSKSIERRDSVVVFRQPPEQVHTTDNNQE